MKKLILAAVLLGSHVNVLCLPVAFHATWSKAKNGLNTLCNSTPVQATCLIAQLGVVPFMVANQTEDTKIAFGAMLSLIGAEYIANYRIKSKQPEKEATKGYIAGTVLPTLTLAAATQLISGNSETALKVGLTSYLLTTVTRALWAQHSTNPDSKKNK